MFWVLGSESWGRQLEMVFASAKYINVSNHLGDDWPDTNRSPWGTEIQIIVSNAARKDLNV